MPFNIIDPNGHTIGVIANRYTIDHPNSMTFMVGLTQQQLRESDIDIDKIRENIAYSLDCQSLFGTIKEEKFDQALREIWRNEFSHLGYYNENFLIRRLMLNRSIPMESYLNLQRFDFGGYVLLDGKNLSFSHDGAIVLDMEELEVEPLVLGNLGIPLHCKTTSIPEVSTKPVPTTQPWEMNHVHITKLETISGNVSMTLQVESICPIKKDTVIQIYFEKEKIAAIYGDGILYKLT